MAVNSRIYVVSGHGSRTISGQEYMASTIGLLVFTIADTRLAVELEQVDRVVRAATLMPIPSAPPNVLGLLNLNGTPVPVISLRRKLGFEERELDTTDEIIIVKRQNALLGLLVDEVEDVTHVKDISPLAAAADLKQFTGALRMNDGVILVHDIEAFMSSKEEFELASALSRSISE